MTADFFVDNRQRLRQSVDSGLIMLPANGLLQKNADESFAFRQDSTFWYFTGLDVADAVLVINAATAEEMLILPPRHAHRDQWDGVLDLASLRTTSGIAQVETDRSGWRLVQTWLAKKKLVHTMPLPSVRLRTVFGIHANPSRARLYAKLHRLEPNVRIESIRTAVKNMRIIKQPAEITAIERAIKTTQAGMQAVAKLRPQLQFEYQARALLESTFLRLGSPGVGFDSVVATIKNAATVHYQAQSSPIKPGDMLLIDAGAREAYYTADITRMFRALLGENERQQAYIAAVQTVKNYAESIMKPGVKHRDYEDLVRQRMGEELVQLGIIKKPLKPLVHHYFPSLTSHHLGLDTHDLADYDEVFAPGMVLTIEPGIYNAEEGIGVRLEDDYVITETGVRNLSSELPALL